MKKINERLILCLVIATGIATVVSQLLIIREFLSQFQGNEFIIALIFFNWLILGGLGTLAARWVARRVRRPGAAGLAWLSLLLAALSSPVIVAIRTFRHIIFIPGTSVGFYSSLSYTLAVMAPYCLLVGFLLPFSLYAVRVVQPGYPGARIYMADNLGDMSGGMLFAFLLVYWATPLWSMLLAHLPLVVCASLLFVAAGGRRGPGCLAAAGVLGLLAALLFFETASLAPPAGTLVDYRETRYGRISVHRDQDQVTLFADGAPLTSSENLALAEEIIHYPLSQLNRPRRVLLISAQGGVMQELAKYPLEAVDYVELNPGLSEAQFQYDLVRKIPGLNVLHQDGRAYLKEAASSYDAIIVNLPEPGTFQVNRFYTRRFFQLAADRLTPGGVLSFSMAGFDNYLAEPQRQKLSSLYNTAATVFSEIVLLPGQRVFFLCSSKPADLDIPALLTRAEIQTAYISGYFYGNLTEARILRLNGLMDPGAPLNDDWSPRLMRLMFSQWFGKFATSPTLFFIVLGVLALGYLALINREEFVLFTTGWMTMGTEILVIFAFQIFFGYIYFQIGLIVTVFLAGLLPGAWLGQRRITFSRRLLALTDGVLIILMGLFMLGVFYGGDRLPESVYLVFGFFVSLTCGFQFPVALNLRKDDNSAAARTFSADLMGAACGTLATSVVLIPYFGLLWAAAGLMILKGISLAIIGGRHANLDPASISLL